MASDHVFKIEGLDPNSDATIITRYALTEEDAVETVKQIYLMLTERWLEVTIRVRRNG